MTTDEAQSAPAETMDARNQCGHDTTGDFDD
jgi:hypothetical protein